MPHAYTEDQLVEQPAIGLFAELGWQVATPHPHPNPLPAGEGEWVDESGLYGRETKSEVVLVSRLRAALIKMNPLLPPEAISTAVDELVRDRSAMGLPAANREIYALLKDGVRVSIPEPEAPPGTSPEGRGRQERRSRLPIPAGDGDEGLPRGGGQRLERVRVIDWDHPEANDFLLVSQFSVTGALYTCRPDLVGFVNGLPWVVIELKKPGVPARAAFDENITHYKQQIPALFWSNALLIASNGTDSRVGSLTADWERWVEWKRIEREDEPRCVSLEVMLRGTCDRTRLLDLVENFTLFSEHKARLVKILGQNHQYLGVNNAIASMLEARSLGHGRGGVFWQTQGSGKSFSMVFFAQKVLRKLSGNWTFVVVTDRVELDEQIAKTFKATGAVGAAEGDACHAASGAHLRELLRGNHRYVFTLIQKFRPEVAAKDHERENSLLAQGLNVRLENEQVLDDIDSALCANAKTARPSTSGRGDGGEGRQSQMPKLSDRSDIIVIVDEAHRSQYDTLALNMRAALPKAMFLAFTGTPLIAGEERTKEVFGDYVSIYDFQQSIEDGATVPLFYENRTPELQLVNPDLNEDIYQLIEEADLDAEQETKLEKVLGRQYHLITRDDRLETVAQDIMRHFLGRGFVGKAMVVCIDKATALRMHNKVKKHWAAETTRVEKEIAKSAGYRAVHDPDRLRELRERLGVLTSTDMAVIVSPGQNEVQQMQKLGLDIEQHRKRMNESQPGLDEKFKDTDDPLGLVFVCAMWLTGFDAPSCSTVYLDKPMRNHSLMQTIARANRVFPGKHSGVIVDYANVFASLEKALAIYGAGRGGKAPVRDKQQLVEELRKAVADATAFCMAHGVRLADIEDAAAGSMERLSRIEDGMNALISPDPLRREFLAHERLVGALYRAVKPDPSVLEFASRVACLATLAETIRATLHPDPADISAIMAQINGLLDESITGHEIHYAGPPALDLSKINFQALAQRFKQSKHKNTRLEVLKAAVRAQLEKLILLNRTRADFAGKFEALIESYNAGSRSIEELFEELLELSNCLTDEQERHVREYMSEEELVIFDILTRPAPELSAEERDEVKKVARELLTRLKALLVLNWRQKSTARSQLKLTIEDILDSGLPRAYTPELYNQKCSAVFEHVYESYPERHTGVYADVA